MRAKWQLEWANKPLPPPPPQIFATHEEAKEACQTFARRNGYDLATKSTKTDKVGWRNWTISNGGLPLNRTGSGTA